jgi:hypothetical protein
MRKDAKEIYQTLNNIEREVSDLRKLFEISGVGNFATENEFIKASIFIYFFN